MFRPGLAISLLLAFAFPRLLAGQGTTDVITGIVTNDRGQPVAEAVVEAVSLETQISRTARTNASGRYTIVFPDGGGQYRLTVRAIGSTPIQRMVARQADDDRIVANVRMSSSAVVLEEIRVRGRRQAGDQQNPGAGATERVITPEQAARLPIDASDLLQLATLAPGVVSLTGNDSTPDGFSVAGLRPTSNSITLDGLTFGATSVPPDAVRSTRVITSTYDPARGQFSGAQIASTTRSGTNVASGTANYSFRDRSLTVSSTEDDPFLTGFSQHQFSFGLGGPLIKNKLFLFGSALGRLRGDELQSVLSAPAATLTRLGVAPDSVGRLLSLLNTAGVPIDHQLAGGDRSTDNLSSLLRVDYLMGANHTLTLRGDYRQSRQDPNRIGPLTVPSADSRLDQHGGGVMASVSSRFGESFVNEVRAYVSGSRSTAPAGNELPAGRVQVVSDLPVIGQGATALSFGGIAGLPTQSSSNSVEATEEFSWIPGSGAHRFKIGALLNITHNQDDASPNRFGSYTFNSLADLEAGRAATFTRTLTPQIRDTRNTGTAVYFADTWRPGEGLLFTYGFRVEHSSLGGAPEFNPAVAAAFGLRTDQWPSELHVSPRVGFTWYTGASGVGPPKLILRGGIGEFRSPVPSGLLAAAQAAPGLGNTESQLFCVGPAVPIPDWSAYAQDPAAIPTSCLTPAPGPIGVPTRGPTVTGFAPDFTAPRAWRGSLGIQRRVGLAMLGLELSHSRGVSQFGVRDLNLGAPQFLLAGENRPVYAPALAIDPATGAVPIFASRRDATFGNVFELGSDLQSRSYQATLSFNGATKTGAFFNLSYTWMHSRDQSSFSFGSAARGFSQATTGGDPNQREWATSDFERQHSFVGTLTYPVTPSVEITTIIRVSSGAPYTPMVGADINGDGARNDRAFIFGASAPDTAVAGAMQRLLTGGSASARECLLSQLGSVAARNSCRGPWQTSFDLQLNYRPRWLGLDRRLMISTLTSNLLVGIDELFHGVNGLHGWGQAIRPDNTLLFVRGFDPATLAYRYVVNERFGASGTNTVAVRQPFQVGLQLRYTLGPDPVAQFRAGLRGLRGGGGGGGRDGGGRPGGDAQGGAGAPNLVERITSMTPNPAQQILEIKIALRLSDEQVTKLQTVADSLTALTKQLATKAASALEKAGPNPDQGVLFASIRPLFQAGRENRAWALKQAQGILTADQWQQVPDRIKTPPQGGGFRRPQ